MGTGDGAASEGAPNVNIPMFEVADQRVYFTSSEDLSFLPPESVDFFMTSPPYWNLKDYGHPEEIGPGEYEQYLDRLNTVWSECYRLATSDAAFVLNIGNRRHKKHYYPIGLDIASRMKGWVLWDILIWYVPNALPQPNHYIERLFDNKFEFLLVFTKDGATDYEFHKPRVPQKYAVADPRAHKKNERGRCVGNVVRVPAYRPPNVKQLGYHVAAYPEELVALMLESFTSPGDVVLDPFVGSGTTLKVSRGMGRRGTGIEINQDYSELIKRRIMEPFEETDWRDVDILHSSTMTPGTTKPRKIHLLRTSDQEDLFSPSEDAE
jgi:DNA modification methylase